MKILKRCSSSSLPESILDYEDVLTEILVRVPARILLGFKCVSKHWLSFISDPKFCNLHTLRNSNSSTSAVFCKFSRGIGFIPLDLDPTNKGSGSPSCNPLPFISRLLHDNFTIMQSSNGLFLCHPEIVLPSVIPAADVVRLNTPPYYFVLNPTTNQFVKLNPPPPPALTTTTPQIVGHALAFDPSKSPHYKLVFVWLVKGPGPRGRNTRYHHLEIYSSETKTWRLRNRSLDPFGEAEGVYCNGAVHWVGAEYEMVYYHIEEDRVGWVDGLPFSMEKSFESMTSQCFQNSSAGQLHLIRIHFPHLTRFEVLEMGRDYSGWFVKYNVDLHPLSTAYPSVDEFYVLFLTQGEDEEEHSTLLLHAPGKVFFIISRVTPSNRLTWLPRSAMMIPFAELAARIIGIWRPWLMCDESKSFFLFCILLYLPRIFNKVV